MADFADRVDAANAVYIAAALTHRRPQLAPIGRCYNCDDTLDAGCFCDGDCRIDYQRRQVWTSYS